MNTTNEAAARKPAAYTLRIDGRVGSPRLDLNTIAIHAKGSFYGWHRNGGCYELSAKCDEPASLKEIAATIRATFSGVQVRATTRRVIVRPTKAMASLFTELDAEWQRLAAANTPHREMALSMLNHPAYAEYREEAHNG